MLQKFDRKHRKSYKNIKKFNRKEKVLKEIIRPFCLYLCNSGNKRGVFECEFKKCPLYHYRFDDFSE